MPEQDGASGRTPTDASRGRTRAGAAPSTLSVTAYVTALTLAAAAFVVASTVLLDAPPSSRVILLTLLGLLGVTLRERELGPHLGVSFATVVLAAALPLAGPAGAALVGYLSFFCDLRRQSTRTRLFNAAMAGCMGGAGGLVYLGLGGTYPLEQGLSVSQLLVSVALPLAAGYVVMTVLNTLIIGVMAQLVSGAVALQVAARTLRSLGIGYMTHAVIAFLFVVLWVPAGVQEFSAALILAPLILAQWTLSRDAAERRSHARTVTTLVAALEAANPYSQGHSARVAELCDRMAPRLGVVGDQAEELHFAALLHDIGLVAVTPRLPAAGTGHDLDYLVAISEHSEAGVRMLQDIEFLADALPGILHHHERLDARGYPAGLRGEDIPLFARMIAVADAFDSLTTTRSYREALDQDAALAVLRERVGTHLDGEVVEALAAALAERPWEPTLIEEDLRSALGEAHDHDDPVFSDRYADWSPELEEGAR